MKRITIFRIIRKLYKIITLQKDCNPLESGLIEYRQADANNYILRTLQEKGNNGLMIAKFGTYELRSLIVYLYEFKQQPLPTFYEMLNSDCLTLRLKSCLSTLSFNAGLFPMTEEEAKLLCEEYRASLPQIDILASYQQNEKIVKKAMKCKYVDLDGFYAPFKFDEPWTQWLSNKRVLVIHPFVESIKKQYEENREKLFMNPKVLPKFKELICIKAIQSAAGNSPSSFNNWHEALSYMKKEISTKEFDVALIGCGAYGLPLAAYVKSIGKVGIQLAGWTQMLFGIYGERWISQQTEYKKFINKYWIRPSKNETPPLAQKIENGCYW